MRHPFTERATDARTERHGAYASLRRAARASARVKVTRRTRVPLSGEQRAFDPSANQARSLGQQVTGAALALASSTTIHAALVGLALVVAALRPDAEKPSIVKVAVEVRPPREPEPREPEPPPPEKEKEKEPAPALKSEPPREPDPPKASPQAATPPPDARPPKTPPPPRITGLSMESMGQTGDGPAFAAGNTTGGKTGPRAVDPNTVVPRATGPATSKATSPNQVASRIPTTGVAYQLPRRTRPSQPPYPPALKAQGIEADVAVLIKLDAEGKVIDVKILKKAAYPEFDEAARAAALAEEFKPATKDGAPIPYTLSFTYKFRLEDP